MLKILFALSTQRNLSPNSLLEKLGDYLITPISYAFGINHFNVAKRGNERLVYSYAKETKYIDTGLKVFLLRASCVLLFPLGVLGIISKSLALITSGEMRSIYYSWQRPIPVEYDIIAYKSREHALTAKLYNNLSIIEAAIERKQAIILMEHILGNPKLWFIHYKQDFSIVGLFEVEEMCLTPTLSECVCVNSGNFNRHLTQRRQQIEAKITQFSSELSKTKNNISYLALGSGDLLQELIYCFLKLKNGIQRLDATFIDPIYANKDKLKTKTDLFIRFISAIAKEFNAKFEYRFLSNIKELNAEEKFDIITVVDFDDFADKKLDVYLTYQHLKHGGRFYLSFGTSDFVYSDTDCIESNCSSSKLNSLMEKIGFKAIANPNLNALPLKNEKSESMNIGFSSPISSMTTHFLQENQSEALTQSNAPNSNNEVVESSTVVKLEF